MPTPKAYDSFTSVFSVQQQPVTSRGTDPALPTLSTGQFAGPAESGLEDRWGKVDVPTLTEPQDKLDYIFRVFGALGWTTGQFLEHLFHPKPPRTKQSGRSKAHARVLTSLLHGSGQYCALDIVKWIYENDIGRPPQYHEEAAHKFSTSKESSSLRYARPSISTWAVEIVSAQLVSESNKLVHPNAGLRVRATRKQGTHRLASQPPTESACDGAGEAVTMDVDHDNAAVASLHGPADGVVGDRGEVPWARNREPSADPTVQWSIIGNFSVIKLMEKFEEDSPLIVHLLQRFVQPKELKGGNVTTVVARRVPVYRPKAIVLSSVISELLYARNQRVNYLPLCRSIAFFAMKTHYTTYGIGSRFAQCTPYSTTCLALMEMAQAKRKELRQLYLGTDTGVKKRFRIVLDNVQIYARRRDHHIGLDNAMLMGTGATAVEMEDCPEGAFDLDAFLQKCAEKGRSQLTSQSLLDSIDLDHLRKVAALHWLDVLVFFVPALEGYRSQVTKMFQEDIQKHQINPHRHTKIHPLGTNAEDETSTKGIKNAVEDFCAQMGLTEKTFQNEIQMVTGDGKSLEGYINTKKYLASQAGHFRSWAFIYETCELWHTKWTELCRNFFGKWGLGFEAIDPSTLGYAAKVVNSPQPSDLKKVDFYANTRLLELTVKAHMIHCWEVLLETDDLIDYFHQKANEGTLPTLNSLHKLAQALHKQYSSTAAYECALNDQREVADQYEIRFPSCHPGDAQCTLSCNPSSNQRNSNSSQKRRCEPVPHSEDEKDSDTESSTSETLTGAEEFRGDWVLANSILLIRDGIWYLEMCRAVASGDVGRVWEIFKVWIFTFEGGGHTKYATYLLEMFCKVEFDTPAPTRTALFNNMLVNLQGKPGHFHELDLMQEHHNAWLKELAQHKGKEFGDEWYRDVLSMHVHEFLQLKDQFLTAVQLAKRRKTHTAPHLQNELLALLRKFRELDVHRYHSGRDYGHHTKDDFQAGVVSLRGKKLARFIEESQRARDNAEDTTQVDLSAQDSWRADATTYMCKPLRYINGQLAQDEITEGNIDYLEEEDYVEEDDNENDEGSQG